MNVRALFLNLGAASASRLITATMAMVQYWWLANRLPSAELGGFALALSLYATLQLLPLLGLTVPMTRALAVHPERLERSISHHVWFAAPVALCMAGLLYAWGRVGPDPQLQPVFDMVAVALLPTVWTVVAEASLLARDRLRHVSLVNVVESAWRLLGSLVVVALGGGLHGVLMVFLAGRFLSAGLYCFWTDTPRPRLHTRPSGGEWVGMWRQVPVFLSIALLAALAPRIDVLMLSHLVPLDAMAHYSVAARLFEAGMMIPTLAALVILPSLSRLFSQDRAAFTRIMPDLIRGILVCGSLGAILAAATVPTLFEWLFPPEFGHAARFAQILCAVVVLATVDLLLSSAMLADDAQRANLTSLASGFVTAVLVLVVAVPWVGALGAAIAMAVQMTVCLVMRIRWCRDTLQVRGLFPILLGAVLALGVGLFALHVLAPAGLPAALSGAWLALIITGFGARLLRLGDLRSMWLLAGKMRRVTAP